MTCHMMSSDRYTYAKCSFTNSLRDCTTCRSCTPSGQHQSQDDFVHAKYHQSNCQQEDTCCKKCTQGTTYKDACKKCVKSQCSSRKQNHDLCNDCNCVNYVYDFAMNKPHVNDERNIYFVYHVSKAVYKFLLHFKFHFSICNSYISNITLDRFVTRPIMLYLVKYKSHVLFVNY